MYISFFPFPWVQGYYLHFTVEIEAKSLSDLAKLILDRHRICSILLCTVLGVTELNSTVTSFLQGACGPCKWDKEIGVDCPRVLSAVRSVFRKLWKQRDGRHILRKGWDWAHINCWVFYIQQWVTRTQNLSFFVSLFIFSVCLQHLPSSRSGINTASTLVESHPHKLLRYVREMCENGKVSGAPGVSGDCLCSARLSLPTLPGAFPS